MATYLYVGSFKPKEDAGYSIYLWEPEKSGITLQGKALPEISAGTITQIPEMGILYFTSERRTNPTFSDGGGGEIYAVRVNASGMPTEINHSLSYGPAPCFAAVDNERKYLIATHFGSSRSASPITYTVTDPDGKIHIKRQYEEASTVLFKLNIDGSIGPICDLYRHDPEGGAMDLRSPHAHSVHMSPDGKFFMVCEMGGDKIYMFQIDRVNDKLLIAGEKPYQCRKNYGPRYSAIHPSKPFAFVNYEDIPCISSFRYDNDGHLEEIQLLRLMPEDAIEPGLTEQQSGLCISRDGRFLYSTMRHKNVVFVISINQEDGTLSLLDTYQLKGQRPKDCIPSPDGKYLVVANRASSDVEILHIRPDGLLAPSEFHIDHPAAGNVCFVEA